MVRRIHDFDPPDRFLAGAVGQPGARIFYLQARHGSQLVSVSLEKAQVAVLAERLLALLAEVRRRRAGAGGPGPALESEPSGQAAGAGDPATELVELRPGAPLTSGGVSGSGDAEGWRLEEPVDEAFRAGTLSLTWDGSRQEVVIEAQSLTDEEVAEAPLGEAIDRPTREWDDDDPSGPDLLRVHLTAEAADRFARAAQSVVAAGRPPCPLCGQPLDPQGHLCPRRNGHTPRLN
jgi:uncharacterized repeat protein (TIGR03847 family)